MKPQGFGMGSIVKLCVLGIAVGLVLLAFGILRGELSEVVWPWSHTVNDLEVNEFGYIKGELPQNDAGVYILTGNQKVHNVSDEDESYHGYIGRYDTSIEKLQNGEYMVYDWNDGNYVSSADGDPYFTEEEVVQEEQ